MLTPRDKFHFSCPRRPTQANRVHSALITVRTQEGKFNTEEKEVLPNLLKYSEISV